MRRAPPPEQARAGPRSSGRHYRGVAMAFPARLLREGEEVVIDLRPHWTLFAPAASVLAAALATLVALAAVAAPEVLQVLAAVTTLLALARFVVGYSRWASTNLVVTAERLIHRRGVWAKEGVEIPLHRVHAVRCRRSVLGRVLRYGEVVVEAGTEHGANRHGFGPVPRPVAVQREISRLVGEQAHLSRSLTRESAQNQKRSSRTTVSRPAPPRL